MLRRAVAVGLILMLSAFAMARPAVAGGRVVADGYEARYAGESAFTARRGIG